MSCLWGRDIGTTVETRGIHPMLSLTRALVAGGAALALSGCAGMMVGDAERAAPGGNAFETALYEGYVALAQAEYDEGDYSDSDFFSQKALAAAGGESIGPQSPDERMLPEDAAGDLNAAFQSLTGALNGGAREAQPAIAAEAQTAYDCWLQEQEENYQPEHIAACREAFEAAMAQLSPQPMAFEPRDYTVYFATGSAELTGSAREVIRQAADMAKANPGTRLDVVGHTDTVGSAAANAALSRARAEAVRAELQEFGIPGGRVAIGATGEQDLAEDTPDNTDNRLNRRVTITVTK
jgi:OOP family OmpA-OmpF porin